MDSTLSKKMKALEKKHPKNIGGWTRDPLSKESLSMGWIPYYHLMGDYNPTKVLFVASVGDGKLYDIEEDGIPNVQHCIWEPS